MLARLDDDGLVTASAVPGPRQAHDAGRITSGRRDPSAPCPYIRTRGLTASPDQPRRVPADRSPRRQTTGQRALRPGGWASASQYLEIPAAQLTLPARPTAGLDADQAGRLVRRIPRRCCGLHRRAGAATARRRLAVLAERWAGAGPARRSCSALAATARQTRRAFRGAFDPRRIRCRLGLAACLRAGRRPLLAVRSRPHSAAGDRTRRAFTLVMALLRSSAGAAPRDRRHRALVQALSAPLFAA